MVFRMVHLEVSSTPEVYSPIRCSCLSLVSNIYVAVSLALARVRFFKLTISTASPPSFVAISVSATARAGCLKAALKQVKHGYLATHEDCDAIERIMFGGVRRFCGV